MLSYAELKKGVKIILDSEPYEILDSRPMKKAQRRPVMQAKIKNLISGNVLDRNFHQGEVFKEAELSKIKAKLLYFHPVKSLRSKFNGVNRERYYFSEEENPSRRFDLGSEQLGTRAKFLKANQIVEAIIFEEKVINIALPIKMPLKVVEAPPGVKGDRAQGGNKIVTLETGAKINAPLFVEEGDIIEVNTETEQYVRRIE